MIDIEIFSFNDESIIEDENLRKNLDFKSNMKNYLNLKIENEK